uniref:Peptidase A2 domain-containing protein n=1 Tax=Globodera rostochiensis TaxID=31243 RepID=A0A914HLX9_GLORO
MVNRSPYNLRPNREAIRRGDESFQSLPAALHGENPDFLRNVNLVRGDQHPPQFSGLQNQQPNPIGFPVAASSPVHDLGPNLVYIQPQWNHSPQVSFENRQSRLERNDGVQNPMDHQGPIFLANPIVEQPGQNQIANQNETVVRQTVAGQNRALPRGVPVFQQNLNQQAQQQQGVGVNGAPRAQNIVFGNIGNAGNFVPVQFHPPVQPQFQTQAFAVPHQIQTGLVPQPWPTQRISQEQQSEMLLELHRVTLSNQYASVIKDLPTLFGTEGRDSVHDFFITMESCTREWREEKKMDALRTKLKGKALKALNMAFNKFGQAAPYSTIKAEILSILRETDHKEATAFAELTQFGLRNADEDITKFADRIQKLVRCAYTGINDVQLDEIAKKFFVLNINDRDLARFLECQNKTSQTYDEMVMLANKLNLLDPEKVQAQIEGKNRGKVQQRENTGRTDARAQNQPNFLNRSRPWQQNRYNPNFRSASYAPVREPYQNSSPNCQPQHSSRSNQPQSNFLPQHQNYQPPGFNPGQNRGYQNRNYPIQGTGANTIPLNSGQKNSNIRPQANSIVIGNPVGEQSETPTVKVSLVGQCELSECEKFFHLLATHASEFPSTNPAIPKTAECISVEVNVVENKAKALIDSGAETNVVNPAFLHKISSAEGTNLMEWGFNPNTGSTKIPFEVTSFTGSRISIVGAINVPITRGKITCEVPCLITQEPFSYDFVLANPEDHSKYIIENIMENDNISLDCSDCEEEFEKVKQMSKEQEEHELVQLGILAGDKLSVHRSKSAPTKIDFSKLPIHQCGIVERMLVESDDEHLYGLEFNSVCSGEGEHSKCAPIQLGQIFCSLPDDDPIRRIRVETLGELISLQLAKDVLIGHVREWAGCENPSAADKLLKYKMLSQALEDVRAKKLYGKVRTVRSTFAFFGDGATEMLGEKLASEMVLGKNSTELANSISKLSFGKELKEILVAFGTSDLNEDIPLDQTKAALQKILFHLGKFSVKVLIIPPPFNLSKKPEYEKLLKMFWETVPKDGKIQLALIKEFRSLAEVTRYGAEEEKRNVQADGKFKPCGVRETIKFLREVFGMSTPDKVFTVPKPVAKNVPSHSVEAQNYQFRVSGPRPLTSIQPAGPRPAFIRSGTDSARESPLSSTRTRLLRAGGGRARNYRTDKSPLRTAAFWRRGM